MCSGGRVHTCGQTDGNNEAKRRFSRLCERAQNASYEEGNAVITAVLNDGLVRVDIILRHGTDAASATIRSHILNTKRKINEDHVRL